MKAQLQTVRILLVDDDVFFRERFACLLAAELDFEVIGQCESVGKALRFLSSSPVDLVVLGIDLSTRRGFRFIRSARKDGFHGPILVVAAKMSLFEAGRLFNLSASGIFLKRNSPGLLVDAIRELMDGELRLGAYIQG